MQPGCQNHKNPCKSYIFTEFKSLHLRQSSPQFFVDFSFFKERTAVESNSPWFILSTNIPVLLKTPQFCAVALPFFLNLIEIFFTNNMIHSAKNSYDHIIRPQLRYIQQSPCLGVVEAASSSLVTQTKIGGSIEPPIFFCFLLFSRKCSFFRDFVFALIYPNPGCFFHHFLGLTTCLTTIGFFEAKIELFL